ncbi:MAG: hypothetical protein CMF62_06730 [Magnetococcales bacterium]|nr:hypothetical protein [Magnetococcales bacterium]|tara:strand:- start:89 stop:298 length:210 start_codon:yes stop_codon:yes gene_type:complete
MFDIGLTEVALILLVAIFAIGPERMPEVARFLVKAKRMLNKLTLDVKSLWDGIDLPEDNVKDVKHDSKK